MNKTFEELCLRKSVRDFRDEPITEEEKRMILEAALQSPVPLPADNTVYHHKDSRGRAHKEL